MKTRRFPGAETRNGTHTALPFSDPSAVAPPSRDGSGPPSFEEIYGDNADRILNLLFRFTSREEVARDMLQDVFVKVYEHMGSFENRSQISTWIYRIAVNHALNYLKREKRTVWFDLMDETVGDLLMRDKIETRGFGGGEILRPDQVLEDNEREDYVKRAVEALHPNYRIPFLLFKDEHLSYDEIAKVLEISHSAVETRIHRARKALIRKLRPLMK
jgi:RNA polymerase sigma-70 factor, ECF subfamily